LHLKQWDIDFMMVPAVEEEGVTRAISLWHQRNRWAEGGYQRYLDYWQPILRNRMGARKTADLIMFWIIQYMLPTAMLPDLLMAFIRNRPLLLTPLSELTVPLFILGIMAGVSQIRERRSIAHAVSEEHPEAEVKSLPGRLVPLMGLPFQAIYGSLYMFHWLPIVSSVTARVSVRPKRLKWVKTVHQGAVHTAPES
jgi:1,2-diacylglycerol 3-beta-glucosyltransferase